ncbi:MAG: hypothetical protein H0U73_09775 [Tatlockia sp.]|nr:hypothetical protein [Tatlockia sp.]
MNESEKIKNTIIQLSKERCSDSCDFEGFTRQLSALGVVRQSYDVIKNELLFYAKNQLLLTLAMTEIDKFPAVDPFLIGEIFNAETLKKAIIDFDAGIISSPTEFHRQIALAGVVYVIVHLVPRKIYYLSQDAQYYLESY